MSCVGLKFSACIQACLYNMNKNIPVGEIRDLLSFPQNLIRFDNTIHANNTTLRRHAAVHLCLALTRPTSLHVVDLITSMGRRLRGRSRLFRAIQSVNLTIT